MAPPRWRCAGRPWWSRSTLLNWSRLTWSSRATGSPRWAPPRPASARRDCSGTLIIPGNVCAHHHLYSALARGMPYELEPPANFVQILQRVWWRLDRALDEPAIRLSALRGGLDAVLAGTTTIVDHHASPNAIDGSLDIIAAALEELGLRSVLCYEVTDRDGPARAAAGVAENHAVPARHAAPRQGDDGRPRLVHPVRRDARHVCRRRGDGGGRHPHPCGRGRGRRTGRARQVRHAGRAAAGGRRRCSPAPRCWPTAST